MCVARNLISMVNMMTLFAQRERGQNYYSLVGLCVDIHFQSLDVFICVSTRFVLVVCFTSKQMASHPSCGCFVLGVFFFPVFSLHSFPTLWQIPSIACRCAWRWQKLLSFCVPFSKGLCCDKFDSVIKQLSGLLHYLSFKWQVKICGQLNDRLSALFTVHVLSHSRTNLLTDCPFIGSILASHKTSLTPGAKWWIPPHYLFVILAGRIKSGRYIEYTWYTCGLFYVRYSKWLNRNLQVQIVKWMFQTVGMKFALALSWCSLTGDSSFPAHENKHQWRNKWDGCTSTHEDEKDGTRKTKAQTSLTLLKAGRRLVAHQLLQNNCIYNLWLFSFSFFATWQHCEQFSNTSLTYKPFNSWRHQRAARAHWQQRWRSQSYRIRPLTSSECRVVKMDIPWC